MAKILILGGGFGGVVTAERLAEQLGDDHQITLVSRSRRFVFYPALVKLAFGKCTTKDISFDLRHAMLDRRVNFIEAEVARIDPFERKVTIAHGEVEGKLPYDYLVFALGRRLATERINGFYEHAHHLLNVDKAIQFGKAVSYFHEGHAVIGQCAGTRLPVPVYETAFALARHLEDKGERDRVKITVVSPGEFGSELGDYDTAIRLKKALIANRIEIVSNFPINSVTGNSIITATGETIDHDLLMLLPPFRGSSAASYVGVTDSEGYIAVDPTMRVIGQERMYAVGDCVNFEGPKLGHLATRQGEVAATNLAAEIDGHEPVARYSHEIKLVIDEAGANSLYLRKNLWNDAPGVINQSRLWSWAKRAQKEYWQVRHA
ncbi:MAG TPA: FAD-dependent oxidoreductase [Pyrinomonadaceae bacterium]|nr:FAD-dependent oxidoreductase [Pyrinomonadaceae bacterium]